MTKQYPIALALPKPGKDIGELFRRAKEWGARLMVLPLLSGESQEMYAHSLAKALGMWLCIGRKEWESTAVILISPQDEQVCRYGKLHLDGTGEELPLAETELGTFGFGLGGDVKFPEPFRIMTLRGCGLFLCLWDGDNSLTDIQWEMLMKARSIENGCWTAALGREEGLLIDPNGVAVARGGELILSHIDLDYLDRVRREIPVLDHLRHDLYSVELINE